jgi:hypothetical protein
MFSSFFGMSSCGLVELIYYFNFRGSSSRRPAQGMGLAQQHGGQGARREPLGRLDVGEGGDVKRMKR